MKLLPAIVLAVGPALAPTAHAAERVVALDADGRLLAAPPSPRPGDHLRLSVGRDSGGAVAAPVLCTASLAGSGLRVRWTVWSYTAAAGLGAAPEERLCQDGDGEFAWPLALRDGAVVRYELLRRAAPADDARVAEALARLGTRREALRSRPAARSRELAVNLELLAAETNATSQELDQARSRAARLELRLAEYVSERKSLERRRAGAGPAEPGGGDRATALAALEREAQSEMASADSERSRLLARLAALEIERDRTRAAKAQADQVPRSAEDEAALEREGVALEAEARRLESLRAAIAGAQVLVLARGEVRVGRHRASAVVTGEGLTVRSVGDVDERGGLDVQVVNVPYESGASYVLSAGKMPGVGEVGPAGLGPGEAGPLYRHLRLELPAELRGGHAVEWVLSQELRPETDGGSAVAQGSFTVARVHHAALSLGLAMSFVDARSQSIASVGEDENGALVLRESQGHGAEPVALILVYPWGQVLGGRAARGRPWPAPVVGLSLSDPKHSFYAGLSFEPVRGVVFSGGANWRQVERVRPGPAGDVDEVSLVSRQEFASGLFLGLTFRPDFDATWVGSLF